MYIEVCKFIGSWYMHHGGQVYQGAFNQNKEFNIWFGKVVSAHDKNKENIAHHGENKRVH